MKNLLFLSLFCICSAGASAQKIKSFRNIEWLEGQWMMPGKKGNTYEIWKIIDDNRMEGKSYKVFKKDTTLREDIQLVMENGDIFYIVTTQGQNNNEPVRFKMTDGNRRHMEFENPEHDFPKKIVYQWKQNDHFEAEVIGPLKPGSKKNKTILFSFKKD